ncbi:hypothetical protein [Piscirickettsia litoralis]|uniref:Uncharacterized protein n=1 Tax=Piscirickettsia litoralis TaxID=1891921 RepID=A0ABX2ZZY9_9GAMM|nr:hypothetical protein [Piscirickettsia litoralis]ODN41016.1 hypothetical protein BGC07_18465 [Piscirickettsia litoralis]
MNKHNKELIKLAEVNCEKVFKDIETNVIETEESISGADNQVYYFTGFINMLIDRLMDYELEVVEPYSKQLQKDLLNKFDNRVRVKFKKLIEQDMAKCAV